MQIFRWVDIGKSSLMLDDTPGKDYRSPMNRNVHCVHSDSLPLLLAQSQLHEILYNLV